MPRQQEDIPAGIGIYPPETLRNDGFSLTDLSRLYVFTWTRTKPTLNPLPQKGTFITIGEAEYNLRRGNIVYLHPWVILGYGRLSCKLLYSNDWGDKTYLYNYEYHNGLWVVPTPKE